MGAGIAVEFRRRWPAMYQGYVEVCRSGRLQPGGIFVYEAPDRVIVNLATQRRVGRGSARLEWVRQAARATAQLSSAGLALPRVGAGLGGLRWEELLAYCTDRQLTFTRGRVANKNDQCWIEQKNGSVVRQLVGYDRFEGERAYRQLGELYRAVRLYVNFFQPSMKLRTKTRNGSRVRRTYGPAQTPFQRVLASGVLDTASERRLKAVYRALDPVKLLHQLESLQEALWRHAVFRTRGHSAISDLVAQFELNACGGSGDEATAETLVRLRPDGTPRRKYRRTEKSKGPRLYRTRKDPFEAVWDEVCQWMTAQPERNGRSIFDELQQRYSGQFANTQLRTLQRHIAVWRANTVLAFDDNAIEDIERIALASLPRPLRVATDVATAEHSA
jgi:hypothetical protein